MSSDNVSSRTILVAALSGSSFCFDFVLLHLRLRCFRLFDNYYQGQSHLQVRRQHSSKHKIARRMLDSVTKIGERRHQLVRRSPARRIQGNTDSCVGPERPSFPVILTMIRSRLYFSRVYTKRHASVFATKQQPQGRRGLTQDTQRGARIYRLKKVINEDRGLEVAQ